ncbi:MAG: response regulator transcription factor, partial [Sphingobacteriales bacterium]
MRKSITILEDDRDIRELCTFLFTEEGYAVQSFATVGEFDKAKATTDLFLLDIQLPDGNGLKVCDALKD